MKNDAILSDFLQEIAYLDNNGEILRIYKKFLEKNDLFSNFSFIVGTDDPIGVQNSEKLKLFCGDYKTSQGLIHTYSSISNFRYFLFLDKNHSEEIPIAPQIILDANTIGIFSKFIETSGENTNELIEKILSSDYIDINFLFYMFEDYLNPDKNHKETACKKIKNLCKFKSIEREVYRNSKILKINEEHTKNVYKTFMDNPEVENIHQDMLNDYNIIYAYLIFAYIEKSSNNFELETSALNIYRLMNENKTNFMDLFSFIFEYFSTNTSNSFFKIKKDALYNEVMTEIKNMAWDIFYYYSSRHIISQSGMPNAKFGYPIFATIDKRFTQNYRNILNHKIVIIENTKLGKISKTFSLPNKKLESFMQEHRLNKIQNVPINENYQMVKDLVKNAENLLKQTKNIK